MSKPIVFIKMPLRDPYKQHNPYGEAQRALTEYFEGEYYVLCVPTREDEFEMQVFNDPNLTEVNFDQLKEIVERELYELKYHEPEKELPEDQEGS
jgi:hypothetical protein